MVTWVFLALIPKGSSPSSVTAEDAHDERGCSLLRQGAPCRGFCASSLLVHRSLTRGGTERPQLVLPKARVSCSMATWNFIPVKCVMLRKLLQFPFLLLLLYKAPLCFRADSVQANTGCSLLHTSPHSKREGTHLEDDWFCDAAKPSQSLPP